MAKLFINPFFRITGIILSVLLVLLTAFHFWFRAHAEEVIEDLVDSRSNGKVNLKLKKFKFNYFSRKMELQHAVFYSTDSVNAPTSYRFSVSRIKIELRSFWDLVFKGQLHIDSMALLQPDIVATRLKPILSETGNEVSIPREMGRIYKSITDGLDTLNVNHFSIDEGKFSVINKLEPNKLPVTISHIQFLVNNSEPDSSSINNSGKYLLSNNKVLRTHDQDILLPDGRHRINFRQFRINIRRQLIEMDSCTISAEKTSSSHAEFSVFFDTLRLAGVDFDALYKSDLIKADSVYCTNPSIELQFDLKNKTHSGTKLPTIKELIQPLTGNMQLGYIDINNASIDIAATRNDRSTTFTSQNDNIEISGLHINNDSTKPFYLQSFSMAIRDYETISRDSTLAFRFDSIKFNNNKVALSNFTITTLKGKNPIYAERSYRVPSFELSDLSWDELLFNRNIKAYKATLYYPVMNYKRIRQRSKGQRLTLFRALSTIDTLMDVQQLQISGGNLNLELDPKTKVSLENVNVLVLSNELLKSKSIHSIQKAFKQLQFSNGLIIINDVKAALKNVHFTGQDQQLEADELNVFTPGNIINAKASHVLMNELYYNDSSKRISVDGLQWQQATMNFGKLINKSKPSRTSIFLSNISGNNTNISLLWPSLSLNSNIQSLAIKEFEKPASQKVRLTGLEASGNNFDLNHDSLKIKSGNYSIHDGAGSFFSDLHIQANSGNIIFFATLPVIKFTPDIGVILNGKFNFAHVQIDSPVFYIDKKTVGESRSRKLIFPTLDIRSLTITNPTMNFKKTDSSGNTILNLQNKKNKADAGKWQLDNIRVHSASQTVQIEKIFAEQNNLSLFDKNGKKFGITNGKIQAEAKDLRIFNTDSNHLKWSAMIPRLFAKDIDPIYNAKKGKWIIQQAVLNNLKVSSELTESWRNFFSGNPDPGFDKVSGNYIDSLANFSWQNLSFEPHSKTILVDSMNYMPSISKDSFVAMHPFQQDYFVASSGKSRLSGFNLAEYLTEKKIRGDQLVIQEPVIDIYRDTRKPLNLEIIRPLPAPMLKKIRNDIDIDAIHLQNASVSYSQYNNKTDRITVIPWQGLYATISNVRNHAADKTDSLRINAKAYLFNKVPVTLVSNESYADSLAGMKLNLSILPTDLKALNEILAPLAPVKIKSGQLDTLYMQATANDLSAAGTMTMHYHNLKVQLEKKGIKSQTASVSKFKSFILNAFILKHNNNRRVVAINVERNRHRSYFNYLLKMAIDGIRKTTGIKKYKKPLH